MSFYIVLDSLFMKGVYKGSFLQPRESTSRQFANNKTALKRGEEIKVKKNFFYSARSFFLFDFKCNFCSNSLAHEFHIPSSIRLSELLTPDWIHNIIYPRKSKGKCFKRNKH